MGTWGTGPFDSDDAADFLVGIESAVSKPINKVLKTRSNRSASYHYQSSRAAAATLVLLSKEAGIVMEDSLQNAAEALTRILNDEESMADWRDPSKAKKAIQGELSEVLSEMKERSDRWDKTLRSLTKKTRWVSEPSWKAP